jgi:hypothetical protein
LDKKTLRDKRRNLPWATGKWPRYKNFPRKVQGQKPDGEMRYENVPYIVFIRLLGHENLAHSETISKFKGSTFKTQVPWFGIFVFVYLCICIYSANRKDAKSAKENMARKNNKEIFAMGF